MARTTRTAGPITTVATAQPRQVTVYRADVTIYTPAPAGASHVRSVECDHLHTSYEAAEKCAAQLAASVRNYPERHFLVITDDETHRGCPSCPGTVFDAQSHADDCQWLADLSSSR